MARRGTTLKILNITCLEQTFKVRSRVKSEWYNYITTLKQPSVLVIQSEIFLHLYLHIYIYASLVNLRYLLMIFMLKTITLI